MSPTDTLNVTQAKMDEYMENGASLGWLLDPETRRAYVYRPGKSVIVMENAKEISAEPELSGFVLDLSDIWEPKL